MPSASTKKKAPSKKTKPAGTPWRTGTWVGLLVFVSVWMFIFGILVGRGTVSTRFEFEDSQTSLYTMAEEAAREAEKQAPSQDLTEEMTADPFVGLHNPEHSELKKEIRREDKQVDNQAPKKQNQTKLPPEPPLKKTKKPQKTLVSSTPKKGPVAQPVAPKPSSTVRPPTPKKQPKSLVSSHRTLQAASMQSLGDAKQMVARLRQKGYNAYVASAAISGKGLRHRVRIGPYKNEKEANAALARLKKEGVQGILIKNR